MSSDVEYEKNDPFNHQWTEDAFDAIKAGTLHRRLLTEDGKPVAAQVHGACPRCSHPLLFTLPLIGVLSDGGVLGRDVPAPGTTYPVDVLCGCDYTHPGAPQGIKGCGIWFRVELKVGRDD